MVSRITCIILVACVCSVLADETRGIFGEIIVETKNIVSGTYKFEVKPISGKTSWCKSGDWFIVTNATTTSKEVTSNICFSNFYVFYVCWLTSSNPRFWLTKNKLTIYKHISGDTWDEKISFYIDYRDCNYGLGEPSGGGSRDIAIMF